MACGLFVGFINFQQHDGEQNATIKLEEVHKNTTFTEYKIATLLYSPWSFWRGKYVEKLLPVFSVTPSSKPFNKSQEWKRKKKMNIQTVW